MIVKFSTAHFEREFGTTVQSNCPESPPPPKKVHLQNDISGKENAQVRAVLQRRLPLPCPMKAIQNGTVEGNLKLELIREACQFYDGICPNPTSAEYIIGLCAITSKLSKTRFPSMADFG